MMNNNILNKNFIKGSKQPCEKISDNKITVINKNIFNKKDIKFDIIIY